MINWDELNFTPEELSCQCGCKEMGVSHEFINVLQEIRTSYNRVMNVSSGYRCAGHLIERKKIDAGGKPGSHYSGMAVDIKVHGSNALDLLKVALKHPAITGVGVNQKGVWKNRFIHLDMLQEVTNRPTLWSY